MIKFLFGVIVGILIFFFFLYFGGGKSVKRVGEGLTDTGKKMEAFEEVMRKEPGDVVKGIEKESLKEKKIVPKKGQ